MLTLRVVLTTLRKCTTRPYCFKCQTVQRRDVVPTCDTRARNIYRTALHRTTAFENSPSQAEVKLLNCVPQFVLMIYSPGLFKTYQERHFLSLACYSVDGFTVET